METPVGMVYIDTRRQGDRVWVRVADFILPNIHQFPPNADPMALRNSVNRPMATTWAVPLDDTHTMQIGYYRAPEGREFRRGAGFGQDASRPMKSASASRAITTPKSAFMAASRGTVLSTSPATDRGIIMMRNMIRRGIRAVKSGEDLDYRILHNGGADPDLQPRPGSLPASRRPPPRKPTSSYCATPPAKSSAERSRPAPPKRDVRALIPRLSRMITGISAVTLATHDMQRAVRFYRGLGFEILYGGEDAGFTSFRAGAGYLNLIAQPADRRWSWWGRVIFYDSDVDALHARLVAAGYRPDTAPRDAAWGERFFHITDPDGHELSFAWPLRDPRTRSPSNPKLVSVR